jgi:hypothetical protein
MLTIDYYDIESIYLLKQLRDSGVGDRLFGMYKDAEINGDNFYEMVYEAVSSVFENTSNYYNEEDELETWVFMDPLLDEFCRLCEDYEKSRCVGEVDNPFRKDFESILRSGFSFGSYSYNYDWKLSPGDRGKRRLLLFPGPEFYYESEVPCGLVEIHDGLAYCVERLRNELGTDTGQLIVLPPLAEQKEAA